MASKYVERSLDFLLGFFALNEEGHPYRQMKLVTPDGKAHSPGEFLHQWFAYGTIYHKNTPHYLGNLDDYQGHPAKSFYTDLDYLVRVNSGAYQRLRVDWHNKSGTWKVAPSLKTSLTEQTAFTKMTDASFAAHLGKIDKALKGEFDLGMVLRTHLGYMLVDSGLYDLQFQRVVDALYPFHSRNNVVPIFLDRQDKFAWIVSSYLAQTSGLFMASKAMGDKAAQIREKGITIPKEFLWELVASYQWHCHLANHLSNSNGEVIWLDATERRGSALRTEDVFLSDLLRVADVPTSIALRKAFKEHNSSQTKEFSELLNYRQIVRNLREVDNTAQLLEAIKESRGQTYE
jgi:hypothetical protein